MLFFLCFVLQAESTIKIFQDPYSTRLAAVAQSLVPLSGSGYSCSESKGNCNPVLHLSSYLFEHCLSVQLEVGLIELVN